MKSQGYGCYSLSDTLRQYLDSKGIERTRSNLISTANELRQSHGAGVLAKWVLKRISQDEKALVDGIRHPEEIRELRKRQDFYLVAVDAPIDERFRRMQARDRGEQDPKTMEEFLLLDKSDKGQGADSQQVAKAIEMADIVFLNNESKAALEKKIMVFLSGIQNGLRE